MGNNEASASDTEKTGRNERISGSVADRFKEAARLFSLHFRIPILVSRREDFPLEEIRQRAEERYAVETELMASIGDGDEEAAIASLRRIRTTSRPQTGMTVDLWPQESATAIMRNMIRLAAKSSGLDSAVIDSISLDYAQKMRLPAADLRATGRLYENMISDLCREIRRMKEKGYSPLTRKALHMIQKHCAEPLTIGALAELLRVSESTLGRSLKADTGLTFTQLLQAERMAAAARLLTATSEPVQVIAARVGIPDQNYFVKVFRGAFHVTPSEYRNGLFTEGL